MKENISIYKENVCSVSGEYEVEIIKADGSVERPFGDLKFKNLILDTFFNSILNGGYSYGIQAFVQSCRLGSSSAPASESQTGLLGSQLSLTHASSYFNTSVDEQSNTISMTRDFIFPNVTTAEVIYREATVGSFGVANIADITTSRFTFPAEIIIFNGDRLKLIYTLNLRLNYLFNNSPISVSTEGLDFTGNIRASTNSTGIFSIIDGNNTVVTLGNTLEYAYRDFTQNSTATIKASSNSSTYGAFQNIFGITTWPTKVGFFSGSHVPRNYPSGKATYNVAGPLCQLTKSSFTTSPSGASVNMEYFFPQHSQNREVAGTYLWYHDNPNSHAAIYYKFNNEQTIPTATPVTLKLKWQFVRG